MRRIDRTNLAIFSVIILFAAAALGLLLWLRGRFERERTETIATVKRLFSPATLGLPDSIQALTFAKVEQLNETFIPRSGYVRAIVVTKQVAGRGERVVLPWYFQIAHGSDWRDRLRQLDRHSLVNSGVEYGAIYFDYDNSRLNSVRAAVGSLAVLLVFVLALVGRRLWVQEVALTRTTIELEEKRRELVELERLSLAGKLSANIFHDIRKPVLNIRMDVEEMAASSPPELSQLSDRLVAIRRQVDLFFGILRDLNIERFVRGDQAGKEFVNVNEMLEHACSLVRYERGGVEIERDLMPSPPLVLAYPYRLIQVFSNIILNAYQVMKGQGRLTLSNRIEDGWLVVKIADTGPGIEPAHLARLFEPFFSTRQDEGGSGLGLYISRGIVEDLGGTIRVSSQAGKGAAFEIALPIANQECVAERR